MFDFVICGGQKCGTTAAAHNLNKHPDIHLFNGVTSFGQREIEYFNQHWEMDPAWYLSYAPKYGSMRGEKTAELLHRTICHKRMQAVIPGAKLIILLRDPIARAFSQWCMAAFNKKDEPRSFAEVICDEYEQLCLLSYREGFYACTNTGVSTWREGYLLKGFYAEQLSSLFVYYNRENVYVVISERVRKEMDSGYNAMFRFLGVRPYHADFEERFIYTRGFRMDMATFKLLSDIYRQPNQDLFELLGYDIPEWGIYPNDVA